MTKALLFDLDGVLTTDRNGSLTMSKNLCEIVPGLSVEEVLTCYREDIEPLNMGRIALKEVWKRLCATFKITPEEKLLMEILRKSPKNDAMFVLARSLQHRYVLGIITDNSRERMEVLTKEWSLGELFDPIVVSANEHASKFDGTTTIFEAALKRAGCTADEAVFIDNQKRNLVTPARMGMKTYFHDDARNDLSALRIALKEMGIEL
jgi:putative hydrolase of the HAD superfamily